LKELWQHSILDSTQRPDKPTNYS